MDLLYEAEARDLPPVELLADRLSDADPPVPEYAVTLVEGVDAHASRIDELLAEHAVGWTLDRMPAVDRNILRLGAYELLYAPDIPDPVAIAEAVELARDLSTDESPNFVSGLLTAVVKSRATAE